MLCGSYERWLTVLTRTGKPHGECWVPATALPGSPASKAREGRNPMGSSMGGP